MAEAKRYYWLKFRDDFFDSKRIKKLRKMAGGDTYVIIYLKMQLKALRTGGVLEFTGIEKEFAEELSLDIDESVDDVRVVLAFLLAYGMCECSDNVHYYLPYVTENTGSETASTQRVRDFRERQKALHCNADVTEVKRICNVEKEIEIEKEKESEIEIDAPKGARNRFAPPTIEEVSEYCKERGNKVDPQKFVDFYTMKGWMVGKNKMKDWKAAVRTWERESSGGGNRARSRNTLLNYQETGNTATVKEIDLNVEDLL